MTEAELIEQAAIRVGIQSLMNMGAGSCVFSEGCHGVTQDHLIAFAREIALHCAAALATPAPAQPEVHAALRAAGLMLVRTEQGLKVERSLEATAGWSEKVRFNDGPTPNDPPFPFGDGSESPAVPEPSPGAEGDEAWPRTPADFQERERLRRELWDMEHGDPWAGMSRGGAAAPVEGAAWVAQQIESAAQINRCMLEALQMLVGDSASHSLCQHEKADAFGRVKGTWSVAAEARARAALKAATAAATKEKP